MKPCQIKGRPARFIKFLWFQLLIAGDGGEFPQQIERVSLLLLEQSKEPSGFVWNGLSYKPKQQWMGGIGHLSVVVTVEFVENDIRMTIDLHHSP